MVCVCVCVYSVSGGMQVGEIRGAWLTAQVLQDQIELVVGLECVVEADYRGMLHREEEGDSV